MKTEVILGIISGICLGLGCLLYVIYNQGYCKRRRLTAILSIIFTALGIGLIIGLTNKPYTPSIQEDNSEVIENIDEVDP